MTRVPVVEVDHSHPNTLPRLAVDDDDDDSYYSSSRTRCVNLTPHSAHLHRLSQCIPQLTWINEVSFVAFRCVPAIMPDNLATP